MEPRMLIGYFAIALFVLCWASGGVISWCFAAYYMFKTMGGFRPKRRWGQYLPFSLLMPSFFTSEGNAYRIKLLRAGGFFLLFVGVGAVIGFGAQLASQYAPDRNPSIKRDALKRAPYVRRYAQGKIGAIV